jgi:hypothetical protein
MDYMLELDELVRPASRSLLRLPNDRRGRDRIGLTLPVSELVGERMHRGLTTNVSPTGLYLDRVFGAGLDRLQLGREERQVQLEFELPNTSESIWALGEICHDDVGMDRKVTMLHGTGVRFTAMAKKHERLLEDYVYEHRRGSLERLLQRVVCRRQTDRRRRDRRNA